MKQTRDLSSAAGSEQRLAEALLATVRYIPLLTTLLGLGLLSILALSRSGLLGEPAWQIMAVAGIGALAGLSHLSVAILARRGRCWLGFAIYGASLGVWALSLVVLWEAALLIAVILLWAAPLTGLVARTERKRLIAFSLLSVAATAFLAWLDVHPLLPRLSTGNAAGLAALLLLASTVTLFVLGTIGVRLFRYRTLQSRLVVSFVLIIAVAILFTTAVSAVNAFTDSRKQYSDSLQAMTALKQAQIQSTVNDIAAQMSVPERGLSTGHTLLEVLEPAGLTPAEYSTAVSGATNLMSDLIVQYPASDYEEVLLVDLQGNVLLSTSVADQGLNFSNQPFFKNGSTGFYAELIRYPGKLNFTGDFKLVAAGPVYGSNDSDIRGVLVSVAHNARILALLAPTAGLAHAQTYLVNPDSELISAMAPVRVTVNASPLVHLAASRQGQVIATYSNYNGMSVLGNAAWEPSVNAALVAEVPSSDVYAKALGALLTSGLIGLFAVVVAVIAALSTSQAISRPISTLAETARDFSSGKLDRRAVPEQQDEVGHLAESFNSMAAQLQGMIGNLEQRIAERTEALEQQTLRLRTAAEVARDAASAAGLDELLDRAARLILDRFGFYHTGIFLLDEKREYAVLRASPSEAGRRMLENQHRLRIGEQGIVGRVAATGDPRIALDTGVDSVYFSNPMLPNTHSEMALPLKTAEGTIGVIDIQSDQPEAFTQDDIAIVQVMADQLATAIQRTLLLQQVQTQLKQLEQSQLRFTEQSWKTFTQAGRPNVGYRFDNVRLEPIIAGNGSSPVPGNSHEQMMEVPIRLRGQTIGIVNLRLQSASISVATEQMIQQIADRLATALENARLLEDSLRQANKERAIGEITTKISASVNMRNVLQTAVEELGRAIPGSDVLIQFRPDAEI